MAKAAITGNVLGAGLIVKRLYAITDNMTKGAQHGLNLASADLLERSADLAPVLTGDLIRSGRVKRTRPAKGRWVNVVSYGTDHAVFTHFSHYNLGPVSRRKPPTEDGPIGRLYLLRPFNRHARQYKKFIIDEAEKAGLLARGRFIRV